MGPAPIAAFVLAALASTSPLPAAAPTPVVVPLRAEGATSIEALGARWAADFSAQDAAADLVYVANNSRDGMKAITDKSAHFGITDAPPTRKEIEAAGDTAVVLPLCATAVVPAYNIPGGASDLAFSAEVLAAMYRGELTRWNDPRIAALNAGKPLPDVAVVPVWRDDDSGTTFAFTTWLAANNKAFKDDVGAGKRVRFDHGVSATGNAGVAARVARTPGAIGYIERVHAEAQGLAYGAVTVGKKRAPVRATQETIAAAVQAASQMQGNVQTTSLLDLPGAYPVSMFTYVFIFRQPSAIGVYSNLRPIPGMDVGKAAGRFLWWVMHDGQTRAAPLGYVPLTPGIVSRIEPVLFTLSYASKKIVDPPPKAPAP